MAFVSELSKFGRIYVRTISVLGLLVIGESLLALYRAPLQSQWLLLAALTLISGSASVKLPWAHVSISISEAFVFTAVLLYGPAAGTLTVALDGLVISFWIAKRRRDFRRAIFNIAAPAVSAWCSAHLFFIVSGIKPLVAQPAALEAILPSLVLYALTYFGINSWLIAIIIAIEKKESAWQVWRRGFVWLSLNYFCGASVAVLLVGSNRTIDLRFVGVIVPLLMVLYFTFKTTMQRVEDANKHVEQLNALYLSTIETLAMAIDAKDQVTHGHIRRVQSYATQLARQIGIRDEHLLRAIEAAALLHDMGKLAIPEHILNKPGKLTPAEFDKMKLHASVGAEILSAIDFPYPVVPIVRHHHENWDGTGYPDGLRGTDVPIGARILSVVDCFDALTSDRPYRPRLSDEDALKILVERRGSMYDPLVVDTFVRVYQSIAPPSKGQPPASPIQVAAVAQAGPQLTKEADRSTLTADADQMLTLYDLARALAGNVRFIDAADLIAKHLKRLIPYSLCVFYLKDHNADALEARHAVGEGSSFVIGTKMLVGQRLSGWVAANHETICNSESALDLENANQLGLRSCLASPLVFGDRLIGVLTLHSQQSDGFSNDHRRILQLMTRTLADTFRRATDLDTTCGKDPLTGLPSLSHLEHLVSTLMTNVAPAQLRYSLVWIEVQDFDDMSERFGTKIAEAVLIQIAGRVRMSMRGSDLLFRTRVAEFVGFLSETDARVASLVASRVSELVREHTFEGLPEALAVQVQTQYLSAPADGTALSDLLDKLRSNAHMTITLDGVAVR